MMRRPPTPPLFPSTSLSRSRRGKGEVERRALVRLPFRPDPPAVAVDDALGEGEPHARPLELLYVVQPLEHTRSEEHTSELQSQSNLVCRLLLEKKNMHNIRP